MKTKLFSLLFAAVASTTMLFASEGKEVTIDGLRYNLDEQNQTAEVIGMSTPGVIDVQDNSIADWNALPAEYVFEAQCPADASLFGLKSVKVYADKTYINILVEPNYDELSDREWVPFHVYINTDNSDETGGYGKEFTDANADILFEGSFFAGGGIYEFNPAVFKWWGEVGGYGWDWTNPDEEPSFDNCWGALFCEGECPDCTCQYVDGKFEIKINRTVIPVTWDDSEFGIGFDIQQNWESIGILPLVSPTEENPTGFAHKLQVKIDKREVEPAQQISDLVIPETVSFGGKSYSVTSIERHAFYQCYSLTSAALGNSITSIGDDAFMLCTSLTSINIPNSVTSIGERSFAFCSSLKSITIPSSITNIGFGAFMVCGGLTSISVEAGNTVYDSRENCNAIIETATNTLIQGCINSVIPNSVTTIESYAFACELKDIVLGSSVETIKEIAFIGCLFTMTEYGPQPKTDEQGNPIITIESITCYSVRPPSVVYDREHGDDSFPYLPLSTPIYVPANCVNAYKAHEFWGRYDVRALAAESAETDEVKVESSSNSADVVWPAVEGAYTYELVIKDKQGNTICTLTFNANGQLISIAFSAPARDNATEQTQSAGFSFTITGLESGTMYDITITAKDSNGQTLQTTSQTFTTAEFTGVEEVVSSIAPTKFIRDGQLFILRGDKTYSVQGQEVR